MWQRWKQCGPRSGSTIRTYPRPCWYWLQGRSGCVPARSKLGHFASTRWRLADAPAGSGALPEVFVGGEGLAAGDAQVLGTLLHEAAHAIAHTREIQDASGQGRYHNRRYAALAAEVGLAVAKIGDIGWSDTAVLPDT